MLRPCKRRTRAASPPPRPRVGAPQFEQKPWRACQCISALAVASNAGLVGGTRPPAWRSSAGRRASDRRGPARPGLRRSRNPSLASARISTASSGRSAAKPARRPGRSPSSASTRAPPSASISLDRQERVELRSRSSAAPACRARSESRARHRGRAGASDLRLGRRANTIRGQPSRRHSRGLRERRKLGRLQPR